MRARRRRRAAPSASHSSAHVGGLDQGARAVVGRTEHRDRGVARSAVARARRPPPASPLSAASPPNGGKPSGSRRARSACVTAIGSPRPPPATTSCSGRRVCSSSGPGGRPAEEPCAAHEQPQCLLGGPDPRREQLLVELEERDQPRPARAPGRPGGARLRCRRAPARWGHPRSPASTASTWCAARARRGRRARARRPGFTARRRVPWQCRQTTGTRRVAHRAHEPVVSLAHRRAAPFTASELAAAAAREEPGAAAPVQHAHRAPTGVDGASQRVGELAREQRLPGLLVAHVDDLDARPAAVATARCGSPDATSAPRPTARA